MDDGITPPPTPGADIMTTTTTARIAYWMDRTEADRPWVVSLEDGDTSTTLRVLPDATEAQARTVAEGIARERRLPLAEAQ